MAGNAQLFFDKVAQDEQLRQRLDEAEAMYPGSLEIREAVVMDVLLPVAEEYGLGFDLAELRAFETRMKMSGLNVKDGEEPADADYKYWLLDCGWEYDESRFCGDK